MQRESAATRPNGSAKYLAAPSNIWPEAPTAKANARRQRKLSARCIHHLVRARVGVRVRVGAKVRVGVRVGVRVRVWVG